MLQPCKECGHNVSTQASACPNCGAPIGTAPKQQQSTAMVCPRCQVPLIAREQASAVSGGGLLGALGFLIGVVVAFAAPLIGIGIIIASIATGALLRSKKLVMVCPRCGVKNPM